MIQKVYSRTLRITDIKMNKQWMKSQSYCGKDPNEQTIFTARKWSLGQGNAFTPVCHYVHRGMGGVCPIACWDTHTPRQTPRQTPPWPDTPPGRHPCPPRIQWDMINKRAVRILLECVLVGCVLVGNWYHLPVSTRTPNKMPRKEKVTPPLFSIQC